ncbi:MAG: sensor histidine kinase [Culicoidibacterales bacterium]
MIKMFRYTPAYFHRLFASAFVVTEICFILIYYIGSYLIPSYEEYILYSTISSIAFIVLYGSVIYYFYCQHRVSEMELFKTIKQNNVEYYFPYDNSPNRVYLSDVTIQGYNEMANHFMRLMNEERNRLDTTISYIHDMKLPLTTLALILEKIEPQIEYNDYLTAQASIERCNKYINEQLYMSQLTDLPTNLYFEKVDLDDVWHEVIKELQASIMIKKLSIKKEGSTQMVRSDRRMLQFICMQLLQNAIQYTGEGGNISIVVEENRCVITDNGVGIPDYELPLIFKRGYTGKVYRTRKQSGMGLYLVKRLTEVLDIEINVESEEHDGTTFSLQFEK